MTTVAEPRSTSMASSDATGASRSQSSRFLSSERSPLNDGSKMVPFEAKILTKHSLIHRSSRISHLRSHLIGIMDFSTDFNPQFWWNIFKQNINRVFNTWRSKDHQHQLLTAPWSTRPSDWTMASLDGRARRAIFKLFCRNWRSVEMVEAQATLKLKAFRAVLSTPRYSDLYNFMSMSVV